MAEAARRWAPPVAVAALLALPAAAPAAAPPAPAPLALASATLRQDGLRLRLAIRTRGDWAADCCRA